MNLSSQEPGRYTRGILQRSGRNGANRTLLESVCKLAGGTVVLANPYATKQAKDLDDSSQTKSDKKDALTIAKLVNASCIL